MYAARWIALTLVFILAPSIARADSTVTIGANHDNTIFQDSPNNSAGGLLAIFVGNNNSGAGSPRRGLISFDVAANVPAGSTITGAQLTLYLGNAPGSAGNQTIELHLLSKPWGEGTAGSTATTFSGIGNGFTAANGDATWNENFNTSNASSLWTTAGGDFAATSATLIVGTTLNSGYTSFSTAGAISDVQSWLNNPAGNYGWLLRNSTETGTQTVRGFYSSSAGNGNSFSTSLRPTLTITFVPEPATATLVLLAGPMVLCSRRR